jgi:dihydroxyacetone kinase
MLQGLAVSNPGIARLSEHKAMIRADINKIRDQQVAIISGGGGGHEPALLEIYENALFVEERRTSRSESFRYVIIFWMSNAK